MLAIIIPYRATTQPERLVQLQHLLGTLKKHMPTAFVYIIEQNDANPFNRGALLNVGVQVAGMGDNDILCFHDVDLLPGEDMIDAYLVPLAPRTVRHIARAWKRYDTDTYLGGILMMRQGDFKRANGFPNDFWGWGGEDDEFRERLVGKGYKIERTREGTIVDQEQMSLAEKLQHLKETRQKCPDKWERRRWHKEHPYQNGYAQLGEHVGHTHMYSPNCFHYWVTL